SCAGSNRMPALAQPEICDEADTDDDDDADEDSGGDDVHAAFVHQCVGADHQQHAQVVEEVLDGDGVTGAGGGVSPVLQQRIERYHIEAAAGAYQNQHGDRHVEIIDIGKGDDECADQDA